MSEHGMDTIAVARLHGPGNVEIGVFQIDAWCLGVKDAFLIDDATEEDWRVMGRKKLPSTREPIEPARAKHIIEAAEAGAARLGFAPARDYRKARRVLGGIGPAPVAEPFAFGRDGRPCFVAGPDDSDERIERVLGILRARCGEDGFDFIDTEEDDAMAAEADFALELSVDLLEEDLAAADPAGLTFPELCGILGALTCTLDGPMAQALEDVADQFVPALPTERREDFLKALALQLLRTVDDFGEAKAAPAGAGNPIQLVTVEEGDKAGGLEFVVLWCRGFVRAFDLWPEVWREPLARGDLAPAFAQVRAWATAEKPESVAIIQAEKARGRTLPDAVLTLYSALQPRHE